MVACAAMPQGLRQKKVQGPESVAGFGARNFYAITRCYPLVTVTRYQCVI